MRVLLHARGEMSPCSANVTSITACTRKSAGQTHQFDAFPIAARARASFNSVNLL